MADGSRESHTDPKQMNNFTFSVPDPGRDQSEKCSEDTPNVDRVKLSFYTELDASESCEESDSRGVVTDLAVASASSSARALNSSEALTDEIEDRKKRCFDRYDSSESSDRSVTSTTKLAFSPIKVVAPYLRSLHAANPIISGAETFRESLL